MQILEQLKAETKEQRLSHVLASPNHSNVQIELSSVPQDKLKPFWRKKIFRLVYLVHKFLLRTKRKKTPKIQQVNYKFLQIINDRSSLNLDSTKLKKPLANTERIFKRLSTFTQLSQTNPYKKNFSLFYVKMLNSLARLDSWLLFNQNSVFIIVWDAIFFFTIITVLVCVPIFVAF